MIFFDTETTGIPKEGVIDLAQQPRIVELALIRTDERGNELARYDSLVNPGMKIPHEVVRIHGITDDLVKEAPSFAFVLRDILPHFRADDTLVAHNLRFDLMMLVYELQRLDFQYRFPFPTRHIDTVPLSGGKKLANWSKEVMSDAWTPQSHRALGDCERLLACWRSLQT